jgi:hypothetical protein
LIITRPDCTGSCAQPSVTLRGQIEEEKQKGEAPCIIRHTPIKEIEEEKDRWMKEKKKYET